MIDRVKKEPVLVSVLAGNLIALAVVFGLDLSTEQTAAIMALISTLTTIVIGRSNATPNVDVVAVDKGDGPVAADASPLANGTPLGIVIKT